MFCPSSDEQWKETPVDEEAWDSNLARVRDLSIHRGGVNYHKTTQLPHARKSSQLTKGPEIGLICV